MTDIEKRFASNGDNGSLIECELLNRTRVKRESHPRPAKNRVANLAPLRFRWHPRFQKLAASPAPKSTRLLGAIDLNRPARSISPAAQTQSKTTT
jgi:hypothetical protein